MNGHGKGQHSIEPGGTSRKSNKLKLKVKLRGTGPEQRSEPHQQAGHGTAAPEPVDVARQLRSAHKVSLLDWLTVLSMLSVLIKQVKHS